MPSRGTARSLPGPAPSSASSSKTSQPTSAKQIVTPHSKPSEHHPQPPRPLPPDPQPPQPPPGPASASDQPRRLRRCASPPRVGQLLPPARGRAPAPAPAPHQQQSPKRAPSPRAAILSPKPPLPHANARTPEGSDAGLAYAQTRPSTPHPSTSEVELRPQLNPPRQMRIRHLAVVGIVQPRFHR